MNRRVIFWIGILIILILLHLLSGFLHGKAEVWIKGKLLAVLPEGSKIEKVEWDILTSLKADSVYINNIGYFPVIEVYYTPLEIFRRRFENVSLYKPEVVILESDTGKKRSFNVPGLFYIKEISVIGGYLKWQDNRFNLNGRGEIFSSGEELVIDISKLSGMVNISKFIMEGGRLILRSEKSHIAVEEFKIGKSRFNISGYVGGPLSGRGRLFLEDLGNFWDIDGEGVLDVTFNYDSILRFNGEGKNSVIKGYNLSTFSFGGNMDSVWIEGSSFAGFVRKKDYIESHFRIKDFNFNELKDNLPESKMSGEFSLIYRKVDDIHVNADVRGSIIESEISDFSINLRKIGEKIVFEKLKGKVNNGTFSFKGEYKDFIRGNVYISGVDVSPFVKFFGLDFEAIVYADINLKDRAYGVFSLEDFKYRQFKIGLIDGNVQLYNKDNKLTGEITYVTQNIDINKKNTFEIGEGSLVIDDSIQMKGAFKKSDNKLEYSLSMLNNVVKINEIKIGYYGNLISLDSSFSITKGEELVIENISFSGGKSESINISIKQQKDEIDGIVKLDNFNLRIISDYELIDIPLSGVLSGIVEISGMIKEPVYEFKGSSKVKWKGMNIGDSLNLDISNRKDLILLRDVRVFEKGKNSRFTGKIKYREKYLDIRVFLNQSGGWIFYPMYEYIDTKDMVTNGNIRIRGTFSKPSIFGAIELKEGEVLLVKPGIKLEDMNVSVEFKGEKAILNPSYIYLSEGEIKLNGSIDLRKGDYFIDVNIKSTPINWKYVNAFIDADLKVERDKRNIIIKGNVDLGKTTITMPFKRKGNGTARPGYLFLAVNFDANDGNVWIRNDMADMELIGEVGVKYDGGPLMLFGDLEVKQGNFYYLYRTFDVIKGEFNFNNSPELNPNIDIKAKTLVQSSDTIFLDVSGTMRTPQFEFYSRPMRSQADIMTLLSLNLSWEDLSSIRAIEESVTETAFNYWVRQTFSRRFKDRFGIDLVQMKGEGGHYEVVLGKYITDRLFIKARTDILSYGISEIQAEYKFRKWGSVIAENNLSGETRLLFKLRWRY